MFMALRYHSRKTRLTFKEPHSTGETGMHLYDIDQAVGIVSSGCKLIQGSD